MPDFVVSTAFKTKEDMSKTFKKMGLASNKFAKRAVRNFDRVEQKGLSVKKIIGGILGAAVIQRGFGLMQRGVAGVVDEFLDFDDAITAASAKFGIFDRESAAFKELGKTARDVGAVTEFTASQAAEGLRFLGKAGWEANAAMVALPGFVNLATAAEMDFARASDVATDIMGAFELKSADAAKNLEQLTRVNDVLATAVNMANIDVEELFETIKMAGPIANTAGVSLEDFGAMTAFIGDSGIKASMAGTALRTMFLNLVGPTTAGKAKLAEFNTEIKSVKHIKDNRKALAALGVELTDLGKLDAIKTMETLAKRMAELDPVAKASALQIIFGKRAVSASAKTIKGAEGGLQEYAAAIKDAKGSSERMAAFMRTSMKKRLAALKSSVIEIGLKVIDTFKHKFPGGLDAALSAVREFDVKGFVEKVKWMIEVSRDFFQVLEDYRGVIVGVGVALGALKIGGFVLAMQSLLGVVKPLMAAGGLKAVFAGLAGASGPLIPVVIIVASLAAGLYTLITRWKELKTAMKWLWEDRVKPALFGDLEKAAKLTQSMKDSGKDLKVAVEGPSIKDKLFGDFSRAAKLTQLLQQGGVAPRVPAPSVAGPATDKRVVPEQGPMSRVQFDGKLDIIGAPQGSKVTSSTKGAPPIQTNLLGANI